MIDLLRISRDVCNTLSEYYLRWHYRNDRRKCQSRWKRKEGTTLRIFISSLSPVLPSLLDKICRCTYDSLVVVSILLTKESKLWFSSDVWAGRKCRPRIKVATSYLCTREDRPASLRLPANPSQLQLYKSLDIAHPSYIGDRGPVVCRTRKSRAVTKKKISKSNKDS